MNRKAGLLMPVSRATHEALKTAHAALKQKYKQVTIEQQNNRRTDAATTETITRLSSETEKLRGIVAGLLVGMEADGRIDDAVSLRRQLAAAEIDLTVEIGQRQPVPGALPAARKYTPAEAQLVAELHRTRKTAAAFEDQCLALQRINEQQGLQLRGQSTQILAIEGDLRKATADLRKSEEERQMLLTERYGEVAS